MRKLFVFIAFILCSTAYSQSRAVVHINAEFNKSNDWYGLEIIDDVRVYNGYIDKQPAIKDKYSITKVPTLILFVDGKEIKRWEGGLDMKLHVDAKEVQAEIDRL